MQLVGSRNQQQIDDFWDHSGTIASGGTAQLCIPQRKSCSSLLIQNLSSAILTVQFGVRPATATLTSGVVTSVTVPDAGFGFLTPPEVLFYGGGNAGDLATFGGTIGGWPAPNNPAIGRAILTAGAISSIEIDNGGSGYLAAPYVKITPARIDPTGVGIPSASVGILLAASGGELYINGTSCPTTAVSIWGASTGQAYTAKWIP